MIIKEWCKVFWLLIVFSVSLVFSACSPTQGESESPEKTELRIFVTTTFIGDVVGNIAGDAAEVIVLLEPGQNPHSYQPSPRDMVNISEADLIFVNGLGLEEFLDDLLGGSDTDADVVVVSDGIIPLTFNLSGDAREEENDGDHQAHLGQDPHVWFDPRNILIWTDNISRALSEHDPARSDLYEANAAAYRDELISLDAWIKDQVNLIPPGKRELVTDHTSLGYFAEAYGFTQIGAVIPGLTTEAETSGQELAALIDTIRTHQTQAIFVGVDTDPTLAHRVADETGVELVSLYFGSLSAGTPADTYLNFMHFNVEAITNALQ
ncbi:MAG: zinc ABC transporter substrate-binding protein [Anaerolineales bacterium]|nr:MAG: zinc ABC transporter substrate-binding protein [Anaerolineales bacterium]